MTVRLFLPQSRCRRVSDTRLPGTRGRGTRTYDLGDPGNGLNKYYPGRERVGNGLNVAPPTNGKKSSRNCLQEPAPMANLEPTQVDLDGAERGRAARARMSSDIMSRLVTASTAALGSWTAGGASCVPVQRCGGRERLEQAASRQCPVHARYSRRLSRDALLGIRHCFQTPRVPQGSGSVPARQSITLQRRQCRAHAARRQVAVLGPGSPCDKFSLCPA